jgi:hypothetical protein
VKRIFDNGVSKRIFGPKGDKITEIWRMFHNELRNLNSSPDNIRVIKSVRMR